MPIPNAIGRLNRIGLNHLMRPLATWLPGLGVVTHRGRRSGRTYRTPVNVFAAPGGYVFALTYGPETDWVKNVQAAGSCELMTRRHRFRLVAPHRFHDESRHHTGIVARPILRLLGVDDFLSLEVEPEATHLEHE
jgi:deazaflavin-dependent oxidoreductase (nitroreductase family)